MSDDPRERPDIDTLAALDTVTAALAKSEVRDGQHQMASLVERAIENKRHLVVQAGTGTGKTLAYLVPALASGSLVVVATATKALQDQLASKDLPFLGEHLGIDFDWAVLKGRSNYVCLQRLSEMANPDQGALELDDMAVITKAEIKKLADWSATTSTGDVAELDWTPTDNAWRAVSVGSDECPGAEQCPQGAGCFAEGARRKARDSDVVVVNTHLYGLHVAAENAILPDHDVVIFDEAHVLEDIMSDTVGAEISPGRFIALSATIRKILDDPATTGDVASLAETLRDALSAHVGERLTSPLPDSIQEPLAHARMTLASANEELIAIETTNETPSSAGTDLGRGAFTEAERAEIVQYLQDRNLVRDDPSEMRQAVGEDYAARYPTMPHQVADRLTIAAVGAYEAERGRSTDADRPWPTAGPRSADAGDPGPRHRLR